MANRWPAARLRFRSEVRTRRAGVTLLVLVIGVSASIAMAATAGARRSNTAYARFLQWAHDPELTVGGCDCSADELDTALERLRAAPFVLDSVRGGFASVVAGLPDGNQPSFLAMTPTVDLEGRLGRDLPRVKVLQGRLPRRDDPNEVSIGWLPAERFELGIGEELELQGLDSGGQPYLATTVRIVGIHVAPGELPSASGPQGTSMLLTPAFARAFPDLVQRVDDSLMVRLRPGATREEVSAFIDRLDVGIDVNESADLSAGIERTIRIETLALATLAFVVFAVGLVVAGQMLRRQAGAEVDEREILSALGGDRADALRVGFLRGATLGLLGAALGMVVAGALSPLFPVGIGRIADPDVGFHVDLAVSVIGFVLTFTVVALLGLATAAYDLRSARRGRSPRTGRTPRVVPSSSRAPVVVGLAFALAGRGRQQGSRARVSLVSLVIVVVVLTGTAVTVASFDHLVEHRDLAGATWQAAFLPPEEEGRRDLRAELEDVRRIPGVDAATATGWATPAGLYVDGHPVDAQIFGDEGGIQPAIGRGRAPVTAGEIALGARTLDQLGLRVGDEVELSLTPDGSPERGRVVGEVVLASPFFFDFAPGTGAATTAATFSELGLSPEESTGIILVRYRLGVDQLLTFNAVERALGTTAAFETADRQGITGLSRIRLVPNLLLLALLALVAAAVAHMLLVSVAGHRRDIAILRTLGFTRLQSRTTIAIHASLLVGAVCALGIPLGVVLGRTAWHRIAANLFVVARPISAVPPLLLVALVLLVVANVAALAPAHAAVNLKPAAVLRAD